eukprot:7150440-Prymnesium_polylepis.1
MGRGGTSCLLRGMESTATPFMCDRHTVWSPASALPIAFRSAQRVPVGIDTCGARRRARLGGG